jgi:hypothetical protein
MKIRTRKTGKEVIIQRAKEEIFINIFEIFQ